MLDRRSCLWNVDSIKDEIKQLTAEKSKLNDKHNEVGLEYRGYLHKIDTLKEEKSKLKALSK